MVTIILLFLGTITTDPTPNFEQLTADYFFDKIWIKPSEFVDHYFIKLDKGGQIIERCEFNEII